MPPKCRWLIRRRFQGKSVPTLVALYLFASFAVCAASRSAYEVTLAPRVRGPKQLEALWKSHCLWLGEPRSTYRRRGNYLIVMTEAQKQKLSEDVRVASVSSIYDTRAGPNLNGIAHGNASLYFSVPVLDATLVRRCEDEELAMSAEIQHPRRSCEREAKKDSLVSLLIEANVFFDPSADAATSVVRKLKQDVAKEASKVGCPIPMTISVGAAERLFYVDVPESLLCRAVKILMHTDGVARVEYRETMKLLNNFASATGQSGAQGEISRENAVIWREGVMGQGQVVGVGDSGLDMDSCYFREGSRTDKDLNGCDMNRHKVVCYFLSKNAKYGDEASSGGHGTHVAGSIAGFHARTVGARTDFNLSFDNIIESRDFPNGMAPLARLAIMDINGRMEGTVEPPYDASSESFFARPYDDGGVRIYSNSWGCSTSDEKDRLCGRYEGLTRSIDEFVWKNKDFLVVFAAGNSGAISRVDTSETGKKFQDGFFTIGSPATFKNGLSVGATRRNRKRSYECIMGDKACSSDDLFDASSRGPTFDGRTKPDVVFPGEHMVSAWSSGDPKDFDEGVCSDATPKLGTVSKSGTSMSCPGIAGITALIRQYYVEFDPIRRQRASPMTGPLKDGKGPSASLIKATLINSARGLRGLYRFRSENGRRVTREISSYPSPRHLEGFGLPALNNTLAFPSSTIRLFAFDRHILMDEGDSHKFTISVAANGSFKATLAYTDPPGPVTEAFDSTPVLVNDLDLTVRCSSNNEGACAKLPSGDKLRSHSRVDNVEQVPSDSLSPIEVEDKVTLTLQVDAKEIDQAQPYSLVVSGRGLTLLASEAPNWKPDWTAKARTSGAVVLRRWVWIAAAVVLVLVVAALALNLRRQRRAKELDESELSSESAETEEDDKPG